MGGSVVSLERMWRDLWDEFRPRLIVAGLAAATVVTLWRWCHDERPVTH